MSYYCKICREYDCKRHTFLLTKVKKISNFSGSSPPEIFVGSWSYPNVYSGILSPEEHGNTESYSSPEIWHKDKLTIPEIMNFRKKLIYGRNRAHIKDKTSRNFQQAFNEIAMSYSSVSAEYKLKKPITKNQENDSYTPLISKAGEIESVKLQENTKIKEKVDYLVNDGEIKSKQGILELYKSKIPNRSIIKILSAGLLGLKNNRKLVPTRWSITAVDDTISKDKLSRIKQFPIINEFQLFHSYFLKMVLILTQVSYLIGLFILRN
jgi:hypothetical protein